MKPFDKLRVIDFSQGVAGPYCTMYLADLGCEVIKVEPPKGDWARMMGKKVGESGSVVYSSLNRGKQSFVADAQTPEGLQKLQSLVLQSDILIESFRPGVMERLQLDWDRMHKLNPSLIYCSISAFGSDGPYKKKKGTDSILQGLSGFMSITGEKEGNPLKIGLAISDIFDGLLAAQTILSAVLMRTEDGLGRNIELSLMESLLELQRIQLTEYMLTGKLPKPKGNAHAHLVPSRSFTTADGEIMVAVLGISDWDKFCDALALSPEIHDKYVNPRDRVNHQDELYALMEPLFLKSTSKEWIQIFEKSDILCGMIYNYETLLNDPQVKNLNVFEGETDPVTLKSPMRFMQVSNTPNGKQAPDLGADTEAINASLLEVKKTNSKDNESVH